MQKFFSPPQLSVLSGFMHCVNKKIGFFAICTQYDFKIVLHSFA